MSHTCTLKTSAPTGSPTPSPSYVPTATPSAVPTLQPSKAPTPPPSPTAAPTAMPTFPIVETDEFTTKCPHIHCETDLDGFITVHHHLGDDSKGSRVKHVCGHELHAIGKCGCECYTETDGEDEATLKDLMGPNAFTVLQHVRVTRKAHKERPDDIAYPRGYASPLLADGTRAHISTGHMDGLDEDHTAWEKEGQFHLVDRTHFSMTDMDADPVILQGGTVGSASASGGSASGSVGGTLLGSGGILGGAGGSIGTSSIPAGGSLGGSMGGISGSLGGSATSEGLAGSVGGSIGGSLGGSVGGSAGGSLAGSVEGSIGGSVGGSLSGSFGGTAGTISESGSIGGSLLGSGGILGATGGGAAGSIEEP